RIAGFAFLDEVPVLLARDAVRLAASLTDLLADGLAGRHRLDDGAPAIAIASLVAGFVGRAANVFPAGLADRPADGAADVLVAGLADRLADGLAALVAVLLGHAVLNLVASLVAVDFAHRLADGAADFLFAADRDLLADGVVAFLVAGFTHRLAD